MKTRTLNSIQLAVEVLKSPAPGLVPIAMALLAMSSAASATNNPYPASSYLYKQFLPIAGDPNQSGINYRLFVPPGYNPANSTKYPVVIFMHGDGEKEKGFTKGNPNAYNSLQVNVDNGQYAFVSPSNQTAFPCFFIQPQSYWLARDSLSQTIKNLVEALAGEYQASGGGSKIDLERVIITGLSGGGGATLSFASYHASFYAAAVPLSPALPSGFSASAIGSLPIWFFHSVNDGTVGIGNSDNAVTLLRDLGQRPIFTRYATGGHSKAAWAAAYDTPALIPWLAAQRRQSPQINDPATVMITSPSRNPSYTSNQSSVIVSGTTAILGAGAASPGLTRMDWSIGSYDLNWNHPAALGTYSAWSTAAVPLAVGSTKSIKGVAVGTSWSTGNGGATYYTGSIKLSYAPGGDVTPPSIAISAPTVGSTYATSEGSLLVSGIASDNVGVTAVRWSNDRGGSGVANGTTTWTTGSITLLPGSNVLTISATDASGLSSSKVLIASYTPPAVNQPPTVSGGANLTVVYPGQATLVGSALDDGLPAGSSLAVAWSQISGPGVTTFTEPESARTAAAFSTPGTYVLRLTAADGLLSSSSDVTVTVHAATARGQHLLFDFGLSNAVTAPNWNNITDPVNGARSGCLDANGLSTSVGLSLLQRFEGINSTGTQIAGGYPIQAKMDSFYALYPMVGQIRLSGLDPAATYRMTFFASRAGGGTNRVTKYAVGSLSTTLDATDNQSKTAVLSAVSPDSAGNLILSVSNHVGSGYGYLGLLDLQKEDSAPVLVSADSRLKHGPAGTFSLLLPLTGAPAVEGRIGSGVGSLTVALSFHKPILSGSAVVASGSGVVIGTPTVSGNELIVTLGGITDLQSLTISASDVIPQDGGTAGAGSVSFSVLGGDVNANRSVSLADVERVKSQLGAAVTVNNALADVNSDGLIDATDVALVEARLGHLAP